MAKSKTTISVNYTHSCQTWGGRRVRPWGNPRAAWGILPIWSVWGQTQKCHLCCSHHDVTFRHFTFYKYSHYKATLVLQWQYHPLVVTDSPWRMDIYMFFFFLQTATQICSANSLSIWIIQTHNLPANTPHLNRQGRQSGRLFTSNLATHHSQSRAPRWGKSMIRMMYFCCSAVHDDKQEEQNRTLASEQCELLCFYPSVNCIVIILTAVSSRCGKILLGHVCVCCCFFF